MNTQSINNKEGNKETKPHVMSDFFLQSHLPRSLSFRGPYLSITMPMGRVMADSRKEPTVKARFSISSWSLQMVQPFISRYSSAVLSCSVVETLDRLKLELFSGKNEERNFRFVILNLHDVLDGSK